jgi:1-acyl-sn-glycerol-3-phosphate acyltransferase
MSESKAPLRVWGEWAAGSLLGAVWGVKITGLELVPRSGPLLVACNHTSLVDPPLLGAAVAPARTPRFLAKKELFRVPVLAWFMRGVGVIPLDRGTADHSAMRAALETLEAGGSVAIFPEGTRIKAGERRTPKLGVSFLAARTRAQVTPVRVLGTQDLRRSFPLEVRFGPPLAPPSGEGREGAAAYARSVMEAIYSL